MSTNTYLKELKKQLAPLDAQKKKEILQEIQSYITESNVDYSLLVERFGTPTELAQSYLEDVPLKEQQGNKAWASVKKALIIIGFFVLFTIISVSAIMYYFLQDDFDYSAYTAKSVSQKLEKPWQRFENITNLDISQSRVIIYWSEEEHMQASCTAKNSDKALQKENTFVVNQTRCFIKLPKQSINIKSNQTKVVLVEPTASVHLESEQSHIQLAVKERLYRFELNAQESDVNNFSSHKDGILIKAKLFQSELSPYEY